MRGLVLFTTGLLVVSLCSQLVAVPVTDGLALWLDATDPATLFQDSSFTTLASPGDPIGGWMDKSGNDFHAYQDDEFLQPIWDATAMNGQPALRFDGTEGDGMAVDEGLFLLRPYTVFIVNQYWGDVRGRTLQGLDDNWLHGLWSGRFGHYAAGWVAQVPAEGNFVYVADTTGDVGGDSTFFANGADFTTDFLPAGEPGRLGFMSVGQSDLEVSDADISEVVIYDRLLNDTELGEVRDFLYTKYGAESLEDLQLTPQNVVLKGSLGTFTGGDPGEGLDLEGTFAYAINVSAPGGFSVGEADFTDGSIAGMADGSSPGATITEANEIPVWGRPEYGDSADDDNLETVMEGIRWSGWPTPNSVDLEVEAGVPYRLQLLFHEVCCDRGYDILVEGETVVDNFNVQVVQEGINNTSQGAVYSLDFVADDDVLNISLADINYAAPDNNPILNGLTLEIAPNGLLTGDYNNNGELDVGDLNLQAVEIAGGQNPVEFDLNNDGLVNFADRKVWVEDLKNTWIGDANLDGEFNSSDMVEVFVQGKYETGEDALWNEGDWDGNLKFESSDMVAAFVGGGYEQGPRAEAASAVPEPSAALLSLVALAALTVCFRRVHRR